jgi:hypothetical protein
VVAYRVAIDDLLDWSEPRGRSVMEEATIVDYLSAYQQRVRPAPATYYRRFLLLRRFVGWVCRRSGAPSPFRDLDLECPRFCGRLSAWSALSGWAGRIVRHAKGIELQEAVPAGVPA